MTNFNRDSFYALASARDRSGSEVHFSEELASLH
jgi:hypothetical protein